MSTKTDTTEQKESIFDGLKLTDCQPKENEMKRLVETTGEGLEAYLGERVCLFGAVYIYTGLLSGVNDVEVELTDAKIVYETGALDSGEWKDAQALPSPWHVRVSAVESWGPAKC